MIVRRNKFIVITSAIVGLLSFLLMLLDYYSIHRFAIPSGPLENKLFVAMLCIVVFLTIRPRGDQAFALYKISYGIRTGVLLSICAGLFWGLPSAIYVAVYPLYASQMLAEASNQLSSVSPSESIGIRLGAELLFTPWGQLTSKLVVSVLSGALTSLMLSIFFRWKTQLLR